MGGRGGGYQREEEAYAAGAAEGPLLSAADERRLARRVRSGDARARSTLVGRNLRLVLHVAKRYRGMGLPLEDLVQEGAAGLMVAAERFDPDRGCRFSTYATPWIRQGVSRAIANKGRLIRLPANAHQRLYQLGRAEWRLSEGGHKPAPTKAALAAELGWSVEAVSRIRSLVKEPVSYDVPVNDGVNPPRLLDLLADPAEDGESDPAGEPPVPGGRQRLLRAVEALPEPRWRQIIERRYGLDGSGGATFAEIGRELGLSHQRVSQICRRALRDLRESYGQAPAAL